MAMEPTSSTVGYCTGAQAVLFFDVRSWAQLILDDGEAVPDADVPTNATLLAELLAASGEIEEATFPAGRYTADDLAALQSPMTSGGMMLAKMVATIAMWNMMERRDPSAEMSTRVARVYLSLDKLRSGESIFGFQEVVDAGNPATQRWYSNQEFLNNSPVYQARRMFGNRNLETY